MIFQCQCHFFWARETLEVVDWLPKNQVSGIENVEANSTRFSSISAFIGLKNPFFLMIPGT